jgi:NDP-sugar pyrophosphorylase family protein
MKAMILAAGLGTRLKPLTNTIPKAMVTLDGKPLLYYAIQKLIKSGVDQIIINVHHFPEKIIEYVQQNDMFGIDIQFSKEDSLLDTGGGLKKAAWFFDDKQPFILHNVDVLSDIDLSDMLNNHRQRESMATLAVRKRKTSRYFLFNQESCLAGWQSLDTGEEKIVTQHSGDLINLSFMGIHILSPEIFSLLPAETVFSIIDAYLDLAGNGEKIVGYRTDSFWIDLGCQENLDKAAKYLTAKTRR